MPLKLSNKKVVFIVFPGIFSNKITAYETAYMP
jgi:hypothetical protein